MLVIRIIPSRDQICQGLAPVVHFSFPRGGEKMFKCWAMNEYSSTAECRQHRVTGKQNTESARETFSVIGKPQFGCG